MFVYLLHALFQVGRARTDLLWRLSHQGRVSNPWYLATVFAGARVVLYELHLCVLDWDMFIGYYCGDLGEIIRECV
jgi:hypothetical protein